MVKTLSASMEPKINPYPACSRYIVSSAGLIYDTMPKRIKKSDVVTEYGKVLKLSKKSDGYFHCVLVIDGAPKFLCIHKVVAETFIGPKPFKWAVARHLNDNKSDNRLENVLWGSRKDNYDDCVRNGGNKDVSGDNHARRVISESDALDIKSLWWMGANYYDICDAYGITHVSAICSGNCWKTIRHCFDIGKRSLEKHA